MNTWPTLVLGDCESGVPGTPRACRLPLSNPMRMTTIPSRVRGCPSPAASSDDGFEALAREHSPRMLAVARRILRNEADAQDAHQEALLSAYRSLARFRRGCAVGSWLYRIAANAALMRLREVRRRSGFELIEGGPGGSSPTEVGLRSRPAFEPRMAALEARELTGLVWSGVGRLPERYRTAVTHRLHGEGNLELALRLGVCVSTARVRVHRGLRLLRKDLSERHRGFKDDGPRLRERQRRG